MVAYLYSYDYSRNIAVIVRGSKLMLKMILAIIFVWLFVALSIRRMRRRGDYMLRQLRNL